MYDPGESIINWKAEADAIIKDIENHVNSIHVSENLVNNSSEIYLNLKTLENNNFCVRATASGFEIVGDEFDQVNKIGITDNKDTEIFETPYALLNNISPSYSKSFANQLIKRLENLQSEIE